MNIIQRVNRVMDTIPVSYTHLDVYKRQGIRTVAVFSEADRTARHVMYADEACLIGPAASKESYLNIDCLLYTSRCV